MMGHLYSNNISQILIQHLNWNWLYYEEDDKIVKNYRESPRPLTVDGETGFLFERITWAMDVLDKLHPSKGKGVLMHAIKEMYGVHTAEGIYMNRGMLESAIETCLAIWVEKGIVRKDGNNYYGVEKFIDPDVHYIEYVDE